MQKQDCSRSIPIKGYKYDGGQTRMFDYVRDEEGEFIELKERGKVKRIPVNELKTKIGRAREQIDMK